MLKSQRIEHWLRKFGNDKKTFVDGLSQEHKSLPENTKKLKKAIAKNSEVKTFQQSKEATRQPATLSQI